MARAAVCEEVIEETIPHGEYRGFRLYEFRGRLYGVPTDLVRVPRVRVERAFDHPAVVASLTRRGLEALIDGYDPTPFRRERVGELDGHEIVRHGDTYYGIPRRLGPIDTNLEADRARDGVVSGDSPEEVADRVRDGRTGFPVEFAGWLPVFARFGNCGNHPQFAHTRSAPPGYRFTASRPPAAEPTDPRGPGPLARLRRGLAGLALSAAVFARTCREHGPARTLAALAACLRLVARLVRKTGRLGPALRLAHSRNFQSQVMAPRDAKLMFVTSVPFTYGQRPWVIEVEDSTTLLYPFVHNGRTAELDVAASPYFPLVRELLEADACRGIITHMRSTAETLPTLFRSDVIARKVTYAPLGVRLPRRFQTHDSGDDDTINLLFTNSWHQQVAGFFLRGGLDVLEAYDILRARYPQVRLTLRSAIPPLDERYRRIIETGWVRVIDRFLPARQMGELQRESHVCLLPSARIHIVSVLQAMSYGQAVVVSDGWGMDEYVTDGATGLVVPGRAGKVSWVDRRAGLLREDYRPMYAPNPEVVDGLVRAVSRLVEERALRRRLGQAARREVETRYTLERWNAALKAAFDRARAGG